MVEGITTYFANLDSYVKEQRRIGVISDDVLSSQVNCVTTMISNLKAFELGDATRLQILFDVPFLGAVHKSALASAIDRRLSSNTSKPRSNSRKTQSCDGFLNYMFQSSWDTIASGSMAIQVDTVSRLANLYGITCPKETLTGLMALIRAVHSHRAKKLPGLPSPKVLKDYKCDIYNAIKGYDVSSPYPFEHMLNYPRDPHDLPDQMKLHAFGDTTPVASPDFLMADIKRILSQPGAKFLRSKSYPHLASMAPGPLQPVSADPWVQWQQFQRFATGLPDIAPPSDDTFINRSLGNWKPRPLPAAEGVASNQDSAWFSCRHFTSACR